MRYYPPAKDGILHIKQHDHVRLHSDYEYEFEEIIIETQGELTVNKYDAQTGFGGRLLITSLTNCTINGCINLNAFSSNA